MKELTKAIIKRTVIATIQKNLNQVAEEEKTENNNYDFTNATVEALEELVKELDKIDVWA